MSTYGEHTIYLLENYEMFEKSFLGEDISSTRTDLCNLSKLIRNRATSIFSTMLYGVVVSALFVVIALLTQIYNNDEITLFTLFVICACSVVSLIHFMLMIYRIIQKFIKQKKLKNMEYLRDAIWCPLAYQIVQTLEKQTDK